MTTRSPRLGRRDLLVALGFLLVSAAFLGDTLVGGRVLLPADNLYRMQPWRSLAEAAGVGVPHNELISDVVLQNVGWKRFAAAAVRAGTLPLWNPHTLAGVPFLAAGQYGVLYPPGVLFYLLAPERAYAWYTALHLWLAGIFAYVYLRVIGASRLGGAVAGLAFSLSGFVVVSFLWPQVVGAVVWLPLLLAFVELIVRSQEGQRTPAAPAAGRSGRAALLVALGGLAVSLQVLAGHMEISFYALFSLLFYAGGRLLIAVGATRRLLPSLRAGLLLAAMVALGVAIAGAQVVPFAELIQRNYRTGWSTYEEVVGYALPKRQALALLVPDLFGNPTHHSYFDAFELRERPVGLNARGEPTSPPQTVFWGVKNYVEAAGYVGVLTLLLALLGLVAARGRYAAIFGAYALFALLLALGTPLYALFYFGVPGFEQLHTPFRWLYPYSLSVAVLAGLGASRLARLSPARRAGEAPGRQLDRTLAWLAGLAALAGGVALLLALGASWLWRERLAALADGFLRRNELAAAAFADGRMLYSYELRHLLLFGALLAAAGVVVCLAVRSPERRLWRALALLLLVADLFAFGAGFNARSDPRLLELRPGSVDFLARQPGLFRIVSFGDEDVLKPNTAMLYGLQDVRGYDTVIPRQYVEFWSLIEPPQGLPYSMLNKLVRRPSLESPLLDLLGVRYVLTTTPLAGPGLRLVYDAEVKVYERPTALPRAIVVPAARFVPDGAAALAALGEPGFDPRREVVLEAPEEPSSPAATRPAEPAGEATVELAEPSRVVVLSRAAAPGYLLLADSFFPGWEATVDGQPARLYRANHNFRAVAVPAGEHRVVFRYSPLSLKLGLFASLVGLTLAALLLGVYLWQRLVAGPAEPGTARRVGRNSLAPLATSLLNKAVDVGFAMLMLRLLGPAGVGKYTVAVIVVGYLEILTNFGLNALLIREVARDPAARHRYLTGSALLRLGIWLGATPLTLAGLYLARGFLGLEADALLTTALLAAALLPSNVSAALSSLFYAFERMEQPAALSVVTNLLRIALGAAALLAGWGILGLAGVSLLVNVVTAGLFAALAVRAFGRPRLELHPGMLREMLVASYPLMLNHFLATVFFKVDSLLLQWLRGSATVGYYATAYKFVDGLQIIPSSFVFAIFPLLARRAGGLVGAAGASATTSLLRAYVAALRLLVGLALPIAVATTALADQLVLLLGGPEYLPHSAIALRVLIWFLPFSFVNGVTQYVLIAIDQQRLITLSFALATGFNLAANLLAIPAYGYVGAAATTILSELALLAPFYHCLRRHLGPVPLASLLARPALAAAGMGALLWLGRDLSPLATLPVATLLYLGLLVPTGAVTTGELAQGVQLVRARLAARRGLLARSGPGEGRPA